MKRTNENIIAALNSKGINVLNNTAWNYFLRGEYKGRKIEIGCSRLSALIHKGLLLSEYFADEVKFN